MLSRRKLLKQTGQACLAVTCSPLARAFANSGQAGALRCINVVNFIREIEPRFPMDMLLPVKKQMELILQHGLPATWLLQFDALVSGPFVKFLKDHMTASHEVGFWFEMNEKHCKAAGVEWRGRPGYEWDFTPSVAFTIGYSPEERMKLADTAMREFKAIWSKYPSSVASWNLDALTISHLVEHYGVDAFAVCRDQVATDGFTIWGTPIAGYYPSKTNCWSPALDQRNQINAPVFRMLGQDPVYYYDLEWKLPNGKRVREPDTMEPVWTSGRSPLFVKEFLRMISEAPTGQFAYAQMGQENTFPWPDQEAGYPHQMEVLAELRKTGAVHVETMGESGRRFKRAFKATPVQSQVQLNDPFGNTDPAESSIWYQSRFYRANLHIKGGLPYLRDLVVYTDRLAQPFLEKATRDHDVEQRMPAVLDGHHWRRTSGGIGSGGFLMVEGQSVRLSGKPVVHEDGKSLAVDLPVQAGGGALSVVPSAPGLLLRLTFTETHLNVELADKTPVTLAFEWDPARAALSHVEPKRAHYHWQGLDYAVRIREGKAAASPQGWSVAGPKVSLDLAQT